MKIQVFISSLENKIEDIDVNTRKQSNVTVINQLPKKVDNRVKFKKNKALTWIDIDQVGLSKSRNYAIDLADADYVYLTDDDIVLEDNFVPLVKKAIEKNTDTDIFAFNVKGIEREFKKEVTSEKKINYLTSMKLSSVQVVYRLDFLNNNKLRFDELFGAGAKYQFGEENIMLFDALKNGAKIKFIPETIAKLHIGDSTWFDGFNEQYLFNRGATFWRMFGVLAPLYSLSYCLRKHGEYKSNLSFINAYRASIRGMRDFRKNS